MEWISLDMLSATIRLGSPILLATMGGLLVRVSSHIDVALEGKMLLGSFSAVAFSIFTGNAWLGVLGAMASVTLISLLMGLFTIKFKAHVIIVGIAINLLSFSLSTFLLRRIFNVAGFLVGPQIVPLPSWGQWMAPIPIVGRVFANHSPLTYIGWCFVAAMWIMIYHTPLGLRLRAAGGHEGAVATAGVAVSKLRFIAMALCGALCGLAGADLSLGVLTMFSEGMSANRGFMAVAAIEFGKATPLGSAAAALFFGLAEAISLRLQGINIPSQLILTIPFLATVGVLFLVEWRERRRGVPIKEREPVK